MAKTLISAKYPPHIDATKTPLAYGNRAIPRLNAELKAKTLLVRQRAVMSLCDHLHDPEHIAEALRAGIATSLKELLTDPDSTVRQKATECLYVIAGHAIGRDAFLEEEIIQPVAGRFNDTEDIARKNAHLAIEMLSESPQGAAGIVEAKLVVILVAKLLTELDEIKELILDTLHFCMRVDTTSALQSGAMGAFTNLLSHKAHTIRAKAAVDIMDLSVPLAGKNKAVECGALPLLIGLLEDASPHVRANAAGAIMIITITTEGKHTAYKCGAINLLVKLVNDENSEVRLNALKALTCLSEFPDGRTDLLTHIKKIRDRTKDPIPAVVKAADIAVRVITWRP